MRVSDTEAAQRVADNDNLVGELVCALKQFVRAAEWAEQNKDSPRSALKHFLDATAFARIVLELAKTERQ